jgi:hypothetical protein
VSKAYHAGFYWPTARADVVNLVTKCVGCQLFAKANHLPATALKTILITWPFAVWGWTWSDLSVKERAVISTYLL